MVKMAVDVVLLPSEQMTNKAIQANSRLFNQCADQIILDKEKCLPHVSLAMGCIDKKDIECIGKILQTIALKYPPGQLSIIGINTTTNSLGEKVSAFELKKTKKLQSLHEEVMRRTAPYFGYDVRAEMVLSPPMAGKSTLLWIKNYPEKSAFENFFPHITIGYGQTDDFLLPATFTAAKIALCHLGNHCTCRKLLTAAELTN